MPSNRPSSRPTRKPAGARASMVAAMSLPILGAILACLPVLASDRAALDRDAFERALEGEAGRVTWRSLLAETHDLSRLAEFPDPPYVNRQASSRDRTSTSPEQGWDWYANDDRGHFLREEENEGRREWVMMEADGPGAIVRIWSANPMGVFRFYIDDRPPLTIPANVLLEGRHPFFPPPFAGVRGRGANLIFPIPYAKRMKVTCDERDFYYHVNYRTYPAGTDVESFDLDRMIQERLHVHVAARRIEELDAPPESLARARHRSVAPGERRTLWGDNARGAAISLLRMRVEADDLPLALRGVLLEIFFDDEAEPSVRVPVGDFFGSSPGINPYRTLPLGMLEDGTMYSRWSMPYRRRARIEVRNLSGAPARVACDVRTERPRGGVGERALRFRAGYRTGLDMPTRPFHDYPVLSVAGGRGVFVGCSLGVANPVRGWWGEGDEKIYVDGETFPSTFGTGTEDYFGYAWCDTAKFSHPFHSQSRCDGPQNYGHSSVNRFHLLDAIPFERALRFDLEVWHWNEGATVDYASVAYWYSEPDARADFAAPTLRELRVPEIPPLISWRAPGAIEGEALGRRRLFGRIAAGPQDMGGFEGPWSDDHQLWITEAEPGDRIELEFDAPVGGEYEVFAAFTKAPDYGIARIMLDDDVVLDRIDFHSEKVEPTGEVSLGRRRLSPEGNLLRMIVLGSNEKAIGQGHLMGLDYLRLVPVEAP